MQVLESILSTFRQANHVDAALLVQPWPKDMFKDILDMLPPVFVPGDRVAPGPSSLAPGSGRSIRCLPGSLRDSTRGGAVPKQLTSIGNNESCAYFVCALTKHILGELDSRAKVDPVLSNRAIGPDTQVLDGLAENHDNTGYPGEVLGYQNRHMRVTGRCFGLFRAVTKGKSPNLEASFLKTVQDNCTDAF